MGWRMSNAQSINRMMDGVTDSSEIFILHNLQDMELEK